MMGILAQCHWSTLVCFQYLQGLDVICSIAWPQVSHQEGDWRARPQTQLAYQAGNGGVHQGAALFCLARLSQDCSYRFTLFFCCLCFARLLVNLILESLSSQLEWKKENFLFSECKNWDNRLMVNKTHFIPLQMHTCSKWGKCTPKLQWQTVSWKPRGH